MPESANNWILGISVYLGMVLAAFWLAMIIWTYRDMRARSRDGIAQLVVALMVAVLTLPGLLIYLFLRPRETLSEAYERSLEEEALLQEIEEKPVCPGCKQRVQETWQVCPSCHTRLKRPCLHCGRMLELSWGLCPYCAAPQPAYAAERPYNVRPATISEDWNYDSAPSRNNQQIEFVDGED